MTTSHYTTVYDPDDTIAAIASASAGAARGIVRISGPDVLSILGACFRARGEANLAAIQQVRDVFRCTVGYSDHTLGIDAAALSVALGARIVEKHFTIDKHHSDFRDHQLSADPAEFGELVQRIESFTTLIGHGRKTPQAGERVGLESMRRSIAASRELSAGTVIVADDLTWVRPAGGIAPGDERRLLGRKLKQHVAAGDCILASMVTDKE
ncbi:MAG: N-acetylneuraminate synthase family protein [Planctomycetes bacterium]|nr:N-acetylneuraminate synthase family protein [Planctomycetota bacterium]